ncbi:MAG: NAD(P)-dependent oxidoreductase, partial [Chloroflexi bacterium]|nr:NAD(P)-dependent oxidoreductase [Chloroflexota bacterium]
MKVLVTGSSGLIGSMLVNALSDNFEISALDARRSDHAPDVPTLIADGSDYDTMSKAFAGVDAVIHLAAKAPVETPWPDVLKNNISATHNVYEAARQNG